QTGTPEAAVLPETIAGLSLVQSRYGPEAVAEVTRLHDKSFPLASGAFGMYGRSDNMAMLWVTGTPLQPVATQMVAAMEEAIAKGESPFTPVGVLDVNGRQVRELTGMGQRHYYFRSGNAVIWLAADEDMADSALAETLIFYP
ncbi:MAG: hypothetical protein ACE5EY_04955, partial [Anaerolineae bacterium]